MNYTFTREQEWNETTLTVGAIALLTHGQWGVITGVARDARHGLWVSVRVKTETGSDERLISPSWVSAVLA